VPAVRAIVALNARLATTAIATAVPAVAASTWSAAFRRKVDSVIASTSVSPETAAIA
jgi:hypothetical protein